jgi:hypothetical protein
MRVKSEEVFANWIRRKKQVPRANPALGMTSLRFFSTLLAHLHNRELDS